MPIRLGVNIDHIATLREARKEKVPSVLEAAKFAVKGGADQITMHLREDRRHIQENDLWQVKKNLKVDLNMEMALNDEIIHIAFKIKPTSICVVPEKRKELTTEKGIENFELEILKNYIKDFKKKGIKVYPFIDPNTQWIEKIAEMGCQGIEIHTGKYARSPSLFNLKDIKNTAKIATQYGLEVHAGHGLSSGNIKPLTKIREIVEYNIGYSIVARSVFVGLNQAVAEMKVLLV